VKTVQESVMKKLLELILSPCTRPEWGYLLQLLKNYRAIICSTAV